MSLGRYIARNGIIGSKGPNRFIALVAYTQMVRKVFKED